MEAAELEEALDRAGIRLTDIAILLLVLAPLAGLIAALPLIALASRGLAGGGIAGRPSVAMVMPFLGWIVAPVVGSIMVLRGRPYPLFRRLAQMAFVLPVSQLFAVWALPTVVAMILVGIMGLLICGYLVFAAIAGIIWAVKRPRFVAQTRSP
jgi:hypothetical protein